MRKQIAVANWKMNLTYQQGEELLDAILMEGITLEAHQLAVFAVPFPYLLMAEDRLAEKPNFFAAAQILCGRTQRTPRIFFRARPYHRSEDPALSGE
jgi:triosephosphate isomerase